MRKLHNIVYSIACLKAQRWETARIGWGLVWKAWTICPPYLRWTNGSGNNNRNRPHTSSGSCKQLLALVPPGGGGACILEK